MTRRFASPLEARRQLASDDVAVSTPTPEPSTEPPVSEGLPGLVTRLLTLISPPQSELTAHRLSLSPVSIQHPPVSPDILHSPHSISCNDPLFEAIASLSKQDQLTLIRDSFCHIANDQYNLSVPKDTVELLLRAMVHLEEKGKPNLIYRLCQGLGCLRPDGSDSLIPTSRMPYGLLQYIIEFFTIHHEVIIMLLLAL